VLRGASFALRAGEMASLVGPSGVGKSTFLHVVGTLDPPTQGQVLFDGSDKPVNALAWPLLAHPSPAALADRGSPERRYSHAKGA
jgi:ABC-type iron transport system FetAB ATPase subunit